MIGEIQAFIDRLRSQEPPPINNAPVTDPWVENERAKLRVEQANAHRGMLEAVDGIEDALRRLYAEGADDPLAVDQLDQIVAIIRRKDRGDSERVAEIARLAGALR